MIASGVDEASYLEPPKKRELYFSPKRNSPFGDMNGSQSHDSE